MLPHRVRGSIMMPHHRDDVHRLEILRQHLERLKPERREATPPVLVANQPPEDTARLEGPMDLAGDRFEGVEERVFSARGAPEACGVVAVPDVV